MNLDDFRLQKLISTASALIDQISFVPNLPLPGDDVVASRTVTLLGGSLNLETACSRLGMQVSHATPIGNGPRADLIRAAYAAEGIAVVANESFSSGDTGLCITLVEPSGQRSFITQSGAEANRSFAELSSYEYPADAWLHMLGYELAYQSSKEAFKELILSGLVQSKIVFDPSPWVAQIDREVLDWFGKNAALISCNEGEYPVLEPFIAEDRLVLVRRGARGSELRVGGQVIASAASRATTVLDTTGAGDVHTGAFLAALAKGLEMQECLETANRCAEWVIAREGGVNCPTWQQLAAL
jgi:ribokinase